MPREDIERAVTKRIPGERTSLLGAKVSFSRKCMRPGAVTEEDEHRLARSIPGPGSYGGRVPQATEVSMDCRMRRSSSYSLLSVRQTRPCETHQLGEA